MRAEGFLCSLDVLYGGLGIGNLKFLITKKFISAIDFFSIFGQQNPGSVSNEYESENWYISIQLNQGYLYHGNF